MIRLIPVKYHNRTYPRFITPRVLEIAGHFDVVNIERSRYYSLHTEYSYGLRKFINPALKGLPVITSSNRNGIPQLWFDEQWAKEFATFILALTDGSQPHIIEIHPPFEDYCPDIQTFLERYRIFEQTILAAFPDTAILIENRCGSMYGKSRFLISNADDIVELIDSLRKSSMKLRVTLDIPQLLSAYGGIGKLKIPMESIFPILSGSTDFIDGIHLWGKKRSASGRWVSHAGDLNTLCEDAGTKETLLSSIVTLFDDDHPRWFVPEVNSSDADLHSIVQDLVERGIRFE